MNRIGSFCLLTLGLGVVSMCACLSDLPVPPGGKDLIPPTVSITSPRNTSIVVDSVTITVSAIDNSGVAKVEFYIDDTLRSIRTGDPWQCVWEVRNLVQFSGHRIQAKAYDPANNMGTSSVVTVGVSNSNFLNNGSFEANGGSIEGWSHIGTLTFSSDVPPGGGQVSVSLRNQWSFAGSMWTQVPAVTGRHRYRFSAWIKCTPYPVADGSISLALERAGSIVRFKDCPFRDSTWTVYSIDDTISATVGDVLVVGCSADNGQFSDGYDYIDLCRLEQFD